ncbi:hypothetical protein F5Y15DRAFT_160947 [Xylariaceae sp. FL0016]|nr:hypothetical protein F5Y15DRAFT_160947 [Xylariaceae sp. FL0016]
MLFLIFCLFRVLPTKPRSQTRIIGLENREIEFENAFTGYKHHGHSCNVSSLDLHAPSTSICPDRSSLLTAMSSGGRIGKDAPYMPRDCDMQWFITAQVCEILGHYSQVILVGDSMMRHVLGAMNIFIREDLGYGVVDDWNFDEEERTNCFCNNQFDVKSCFGQGINCTGDVLINDSNSLVCPKIIPGWQTDVRIEQMNKQPIAHDELTCLIRAINTTPRRRQAFVLGHGLWSDLDVQKSVRWLDLVKDTIDSMTHMWMNHKGNGDTSNLPVLFVTPNAAGEEKPDEYILTQENEALVRFEHKMADQAAERYMDHLGTWNMSIQASFYDGVHMDMRGNLLKAMMILNWLNVLDD